MSDDYAMTHTPRMVAGLAPTPSTHPALLQTSMLHEEVRDLATRVMQLAAQILGPIPSDPQGVNGKSGHDSGLLGVLHEQALITRGAVSAARNEIDRLTSAIS